MSEVIYLRGFDAEQKKRMKEEAKRLTGKNSVNAFIHFLVNKHFETPSENEKQFTISNEININELPYPISFKERKRRQMTLYKNDLLNLEFIAQKSGCELPYYISALIRNHLYKSIELTGNEIEVLRKSNFQISSIGNNLNQIAKRVNLDMGIDHYDIDLIKQLIIKVDAHVQLVNQCLQLNLNRW